MFSPEERDETGPALWASTWSGERYPRVPGDHVVVDGEDGLRVHPHPRHLHTVLGTIPLLSISYNWF